MSWKGFCKKGCGDGSLERVTENCYQQRGAYKSTGNSQNGRKERRVEKTTNRVNTIEIQDDDPNVIV